MAWRFNAPPGWPPPPQDWAPPDGWAPDPSWPPAPPGWQFWVDAAHGSSPPPTDPATPGGVSTPAAGPIPGAAPVQGGGTTPPPRKASRGRWVLALVLVMVILGLATALVAALSWLPGSAETTRLVTESTTGKTRVENPCGDIAVREGPAGVVTTRATIRTAWRSPNVSSRVKGDSVNVVVECPLWSFGSSVSLVVEVPPGGSVTARSSAGSVRAEGLSADLDISSSAGSVTATDVTSSVLSAESSAGSVSLTWSAQADPKTIKAESSAGSVRVTVPDVAGVSYRVDADSSAGSTNVEVRTDPSASRTIRARSSAGSVTVGYL